MRGRALVAGAVVVVVAALAARAAQEPPPGAAARTPAADSPARPTASSARGPATPADRAREAAALRALREEIAAATALPGVMRGSWGIAVHSLDRDERLVDVNGARLLVPASVAKLVSAASAADAVGWDYTFETTLRTIGPIEDGVLQGDLLVVGSGDPSIGSDAGDDLTAWVRAIADLGIRRIDGRIVGDDDSLEEPRPALSWGWDDLGYQSGVLFGALNYGGNRLAITVAPAATAGEPLSLVAESHALHRPLVNRTTTGAAGTAAFVWPEQRPAEGALTIAGSLPVRTAPRQLVVSAGNPTAWFAGVLRHALVISGIDVTGAAVDIDDAVPRPDRPAAVTVYTHRSRPLGAIVQPMLKDSINLYAEAVLRLNAPPGALPTNDAALEGLQKRFAKWGVGDQSIRQVDGSGLSRRTLAAPDGLLRVLQVMDDPSGRSPFVAGLPVAGVDGSLAGRFRGTRAQRNLRAKTGTMSTVRSLAGYVTTADGERLAFVVIVNNFEGRADQVARAVDRIALALVAFTRR